MISFAYLLISYRAVSRAENDHIVCMYLYKISVEEKMTHEIFGNIHIHVLPQSS